jgi:hypothetical protein
MFFPFAIKIVVNLNPLFFNYNTINNDWIGFFASYFGAIFGGVIAGLFTFLGVRLTLRKQESKEKNRRLNHKKMLYSQIKFTYTMFKKLYKEKPDQKIDVTFIIFDSKRTEHLLFVKSLNEKEYNYVIRWFYALNNLEEIVRRENYLTAEQIRIYLKQRLPEIKIVLKKLEKEIT